MCFHSILGALGVAQLDLSPLSEVLQSDEKCDIAMEKWNRRWRRVSLKHHALMYDSQMLNIKTFSL